MGSRDREDGEPPRRAPPPPPPPLEDAKRRKGSPSRDRRDRELDEPERRRERDERGHDRHGERRASSRDAYDRRDRYDRYDRHEQRYDRYDDRARRYDDRRGGAPDDRGYRSARSPPRHYGRGGGYERRRYERSRSRSRSHERRRPVARERVEIARPGSSGVGGGPRASPGKDANGEKLFFDGFQWVKPTGGGPAALNSSAAAPGSAQKDRRVHVGNLPLNSGLTADLLSQWFSAQMVAHGLVTPGLEGPVVCSSWVAPEGTYAFLELRSAQEATECLRLHGQPLLGQALRVSRPNNYAPPPGQPAPVPLPPLASLAAAPALLGGGAPPLGLALAAVAPQIAALPGVETAWEAAQAMARAQPERSIALRNFALPEELVDAEERADIAETLREECASFGRVLSVVVPVPPPAASDGGSAAEGGAGGEGQRSNGGGPDSLPKVYVQFEQVAAAQAALLRMQGRAFDGRVLSAAYVTDGEYALVQARNGGAAAGGVADPGAPAAAEERGGAESARAEGIAQDGRVPSTEPGEPAEARAAFSDGEDGEAKRLPPPIEASDVAQPLQPAPASHEPS